MQAQTLTLSVDVLENDTLVDEVYSRQEQYLNRTLYIGANHVPGERQTLGLYRTPVKPTSAFKGVMKTSFKFTDDVSVLNPIGESILAPAIVEVNFSLPVGITSAELVQIRQRINATIDNQVFIDGLLKQQSI